MDEEYKPDWYVGYFDHLFLFMPPGFFAGGPLEGGDCYTQIHYATLEEADICTESGIPVAEGQAIDVFCNIYDPAVWDIHPLSDHLNNGDGTFTTDCFNDEYYIFMAALSGSTTIDPVTGEEIAGAHIDGGAGIGMADFQEVAAFNRMQDHISVFPGEKSPYRQQIVKWIFGERFQAIYPSYVGRYGWAVDNRSNIWDELEADIRPTGFYKNKTKSLKGCARGLIDLYGGKVPSTMEELLKLPGVGRKTANCVLGAAFGVPGIVVDTHVKRLSLRMGLTRNTNPDKIEFDVQDLLPEERWRRFSDILIYHGREICKARKPNHGGCLVFDLCPSNAI